jgi:hypothetical protein
MHNSLRVNQLDKYSTSHACVEYQGNIDKLGFAWEDLNRHRIVKPGQQAGKEANPNPTDSTQVHRAFWTAAALQIPYHSKEREIAEPSKCGGTLPPGFGKRGMNKTKPRSTKLSLSLKSPFLSIRMVNGGVIIRSIFGV